MAKRGKKADPETTQTPLETPLDATPQPEPTDSPTVIEPPPTTDVTIPTAQQIIQQVADSTDLDPTTHEQKPFTQTVRRADPFSSRSFQFPDGYRIRMQESDSRKTVEVQFGDGTRADQPQNFEAIKPFLKDEGMSWNGTNAWVSDLVPERGSLAQREDARRTNHAIRARMEDVILPAVVALEEEKRGEIEVTDEARLRINKARGGVGSPG